MNKGAARLPSFAALAPRFLDCNRPGCFRRDPGEGVERPKSLHTFFIAIEKQPRGLTPYSLLVTVSELYPKLTFLAHGLPVYAPNALCMRVKNYNLKLGIIFSLFKVPLKPAPT